MKQFEIRWWNFRGFRDTSWLTIRPLTLLIGPNNSGKTSLHLPLLLLKQTLAARDPSIGLLMAGDYVKAGSYEDIVFSHDVSEEVELGLRFHRHSRRSVKQMERLGQRPPGTCQLRFGGTTSLGSPVILRQYRTLDVFDRFMMSRARLAGGNYSLRGLSRTARYYSRSKAPFADARVDPYLKAIRKARPEGFLFRSSTIIQEVTEATLSPSKSPEEQGQIMSAESLMYFRITGWVESEITDRLDQVSYIGPLRERPQRSYVISGETPPDVGTRGQFAPEIVFRNRDARKRRAVSRWLAAFDLPPTVHFRDLGEGIFSLRLRGTKTDLPVNLADTGFGVSQVLPLIVQGTYGEEGGLIVAEQPEIHLNPRQQSKLADLFVEIASTDRGVLVETHSEHLVTRLRRLMADKKITSEQVALYFVEREGSESRVREIDIRDNGHIRREDWPRGFFEEGLREAVGLASSQLKRQS